jgi:DNA-binding transcriptional MocR family regulator
MWEPRLDPQGPSYLAITRALEADICCGRLAPGVRLPTHRELATRLGVNVGTVTRAYAEARRRGLVQGEVGRGTFVSRPPGPALTPRRREARTQLLDLGMNAPVTTPGPDLASALHALAARPDLAEMASYGAPAGSERARTAGARWLAHCGIRVTPEQIVVCGGAQHGILASLAATAGPGELVLAEALSYPGFGAAARMLGLRVRPVALDEHGIVPDSLEAACAERPRLLYCMPSVQNPTASRMPLARRQAIAELARAHDLVLVVDDVQAGMLTDDLPTLASLAPERVITICGLSKTILPALRIAFVAGPADRMPRLEEAVWASTWTASPIGAELAASWIEDGSAERLQSDRRREMATREALAREALADLRFRSQPGGYHLWIELPAPLDPAAFAAELLRRGVAVTPAAAFCVAPGPAPRAVRVSLSAAPTAAALRRGLATLAALIRETDVRAPGPRC